MTLIYQKILILLLISTIFIYFFIKITNIYDYLFNNKFCQFEFLYNKFIRVALNIIYIVFNSSIDVIYFNLVYFFIFLKMFHFTKFLIKFKENKILFIIKFIINLFFIYNFYKNELLFWRYLIH
jgi:hypothetical protein